MVRNSPRLVPLVLLLLSASSACVAASGETRWRNSYSQAQAEAKKSNKRVLVEFYAEWCGPCKMMAKTTLKDPKVVPLLDKFVPVRLDVDKEKAMAERYQVESIPRAAVLTTDGKLVRLSIGYKNADEFSLFLKQGLP